MKKMAEAIIAILLLFGGAYGGSQYQKNKCDEELREVITTNNARLDSVKYNLNAANFKLDSVKYNLNNANNKLDSVKYNLNSANDKLDSLQSLPVKVDTLILINQDILMNTDTIKHELRGHIRNTQ